MSAPAECPPGRAAGGRAAIGILHFMRSRLVVVLVAVGLLAGACGGDDGPTAQPDGSSAATSATEATSTAPPIDVTTTTLPAYRNLVARLADDETELDVHDSPGGERVSALPMTTEAGERTHVLLTTTEGQAADGDTWYQALLPVRPNGTTGWVRASQVELGYNDFRIVVSLSTHQLTLYGAGWPVMAVPVGVGEPETPTPTGTFFIKELLAQPDPSGSYGPFAFGLSAFSEVPELENFNGGDGVVGIHGTNQPDRIGTDVSHGCIRLLNADIERLVAMQLPLGVPVDIVA